MGANNSVDEYKVEKEVINDVTTEIFKSDESETRSACVAMGESILNVGIDLNIGKGCELVVESSAECVAVSTAQNNANMITELQTNMSTAMAEEISKESDMSNDGFSLPSINNSYSNTDIKETITNTIENEITMETINRTIAEANAGSTSELNVGGNINCSGGKLTVTSESVAEAHADAINESVMGSMAGNTAVNSIINDYEGKVKITNTGLFSSAGILYIVIAIIVLGVVGTLASSGGGGGMKEKALAASQHAR